MRIKNARKPTAPPAPRLRDDKGPPARSKLYLCALILVCYALVTNGGELLFAFSDTGAGPTGSTPDDSASVTGPASSVQTNVTPDVYYVRAGTSSVRRIGGERVLELANGDTIVHDDVTVTSRRGVHYIDSQITFLYENVVINQGTITMWGDEGEYRKPDDLAALRKNVRVVDEGWEVTCDEARYSRMTGKATLLGNVVAKDSATTLYADSLFYDKEQGIAEVFGNIHITDSEEGFSAEGEHGFYYRDTQKGVIDRDPRLTVDPDSDEPVTINSDTMLVYPDAKNATAYYRVKILKGNTVTQCDSAVLYDQNNRAELYGNPLAKQEHMSMKGTTMVLHYDEEEVNRIDIEGAAEIREGQKDSLVVGRDNWMMGDTMSLYLRDNRIDSIRVLHNATSEYYPSAQNRTESNFVRGETMFFLFEEDSLRYVRITGSADGVYRYLDMTDDQTSDSLRAVIDTNLTYVSFEKKAEEVVYSAEKIEYFASNADLVLDAGAKIKYQSRILSGDHITYFSSEHMIDARGNPKLVDGGQEFFGNRMDYDLEAEAGMVSDGSTRFQDGFYRGENVAKVGENVMKVWNSRYTTCDLQVPHYHIKARHMKVYQKDKVVSGSMVLHIGETPLFYLPFMANSIRRGRRSGFLRPEFEFGITKQTGRYIRNVGYYWATNDYTDFKFRLDCNEDRSTRVNVRNRYKVRYKFSGDVNFDFLRDLSQYLNEWSVDARHSHTLGEKFSLKSDLHFVSSDQAPQAISRIDDVERVVDRSLRSNVSISKSWDRVGFSVSAKRTQNLNIIDPNAIKVSTVFPSLRLSIPQRDIYFGERHRPDAQGPMEKFLSGIRLSPGLSGQRQTEDREYTFKEVVSSGQSLGVQSPQKIGFINISPSLSANNSYTRTTSDVFEHTEIDEVAGDTTFVSQSHVVESENVFTWGFGASANTKFYGTFYPGVGRLRGIRHVVAPSVSYKFNPKTWNRPQSQSFRVSLSNSFDLKMLRKKDTAKAPKDRLVTRTSRSPGEKPDGAGRPDVTGEESSGEADESEEEKLDKISGILLWTLSSNYNPQAPRKKGWSNVSSAVNVKVFGTSVSMNQVFEPYDQKLMSTRIQTRFSLNGTHPFGRSESVKVEELNIVAASETSQKSEENTGNGESAEGTGSREKPEVLSLEEGQLPWSLSAGLSYTKTRGNEPRATLDLNGRLDLTEKWRITYWTSYDIEGRELRGQNFSIHRDLHCWEMSLSRQLLGDEWQFYFKINLLVHPELYAETGRRGLGGFAGGMTGSSFLR